MYRWMLSYFSPGLSQCQSLWQGKRHLRESSRNSLQKSCVSTPYHSTDSFLILYNCTDILCIRFILLSGDLNLSVCVCSTEHFNLASKQLIFMLMCNTSTCVDTCMFSLLFLQSIWAGIQCVQGRYTVTKGLTFSFIEWLLKQCYYKINIYVLHLHYANGSTCMNAHKKCTQTVYLCMLNIC